MIEVQCTLARRWTENTNHVVSAWIAKLFERWRERFPGSDRASQNFHPRNAVRKADVSLGLWSIKARRGEAWWKRRWKQKNGKELTLVRAFPLRRLAESAAGMDVYSPVASPMVEFSFDRERDGEKFESKAYRCRFFPVRRASLKKSKSTLELNLFLATVYAIHIPILFYSFFSQREYCENLSLCLSFNGYRQFP